MKFGFKRKNHLKSKRLIDELFSKGKALNKPPFRLIFLEVTDSGFFGAQVLISVPKRRFKLAVSRNRIRRLVSESYRLNSIELQQQITTEKKHLAIAFIYMGKKEMSFSVIDQQMKEILADLSLKINIEKQSDGR